MEAEMRSDSDLLNDICNEAPGFIDRVSRRHCTLSRKLIALFTGLSVQTISDYGTGKLNIPIDFWHRLLLHYYDPRIPQLLFPGDFDWEVIAVVPPSRASAQKFFRQAVKESGAHHEKQTYIAEILADGRIDELDAHTVQEYADAYLRHRTVDSHLHRAILTTFNAAMAAREPAR